MSLQWIEGFDGQTANIANAYPESNIALNGSIATGRFGSGSCFLGSGSTGGQVECRVPVTGGSTIWTGAAIKNNTAYSTTPECVLFDFRSGGSSVLNIRVVPYGVTGFGEVRAVKGNFNLPGTLMGTASNSLRMTYWEHLEVKVTPGVAGSVVIKQNGVETLNLTPVDTGFSTDITHVSLRLSGTGASFYDDGWAASVDDWWVANESLGDLRILNRTPNQNGSSSQLVGSDGNSTDNYLLVDDVPPVITDYVGGSTPGNKDLYTYSDLAAGYTTDIKGVRITARAYASDAGNIKGRNICKSGAATGNGVDNVLSATSLIFSDMMENDPNTGAHWVPADFNAAEFGWEVRA